MTKLNLDYTIALMVCDDLDIDPAPVMAELAADREVNKRTKAVFKRIAKQLSATAASVSVAALLAMNEIVTSAHCILC